MEVSGQLHTPAALPLGERAPGSHWIQGWVGPRADLEAAGNRTPAVQPVDRRYPDSAVPAPNTTTDYHCNYGNMYRSCSKNVGHTLGDHNGTHGGGER
jgi:hypothetical protein